MHLPARCVADHVELGCAATIHRPRGAAVDTAHVLAWPSVSRQALYVAMTRGREADHAYVPIDGIATESHQQNQEMTGRQILENVLATDGTEQSATGTLRRRQRQRQDGTRNPRLE